MSGTFINTGDCIAKAPKMVVKICNKFVSEIFKPSMDI